MHSIDFQLLLHAIETVVVAFITPPLLNCASLVWTSAIGSCIVRVLLPLLYAVIQFYWMSVRIHLFDLFIHSYAFKSTANNAKHVTDPRSVNTMLLLCHSLTYKIQIKLTHTGAQTRRFSHIAITVNIHLMNEHVCRPRYTTCTIHAIFHTFLFYYCYYLHFMECVLSRVALHFSLEIASIAECAVLM